MLFTKQQKIYINPSWNHLPMIMDYFEESEDIADSFYDESLVEPRKAFLLQLTPDQIVDVEVDGEIYYDDHLPCCDVHVTFTSGDVFSFGACWIAPEQIGMFIYTDSQKAKKDIVGYIVQHFDE